MDDKYWSTYILVKHTCEIVVLTMELIISTAIKPYSSASATTSEVASSRASTVSRQSVGGAGAAVPFSRPPVPPTTTAGPTRGPTRGYGSLGGPTSAAIARDMVDDSQHGVTEMTPMLPPQGQSAPRR